MLRRLHFVRLIMEILAILTVTEIAVEQLMYLLAPGLNGLAAPGLHAAVLALLVAPLILWRIAARSPREEGPTHGRHTVRRWILIAPAAAALIVGIGLVARAVYGTGPDAPAEFGDHLKGLPAAMTANADLVFLTTAAAVSLLFLGAWSTRLGLGLGTVLIAGGISAVVLIGGSAMVRAAGDRARAGMRHSLEGIAPTYAAEVREHGHWRLPSDAAPDDPLYLNLIEAEKRWLAANPGIADVYTFRRDADGQWCLIVDSETDYNRNGSFDEDREQRTDIGEPYEHSRDELNMALGGQAVFMDEPETDEWGTWVSAFEPVYDGAGMVEAVLGVDFPAADWTQAIVNARLRVAGYIATILTLVMAGAALSVTYRRHLSERSESVQLLKCHAATLDQKNTELAGRANELTMARNVAEGALRETEALRSTVDAHSIVSVADIQGTIIDVNEAMCRISGYTREELLGQDHRIVNSGHHPKAFWAQMWRTIGAGEAWRAEVCNKAKDGSLYWADTVIAPFKGPGGEIEKYVSIRTDITERKRAEAALRESEHRLRTVIEAEPECVKVVSPDGALLEMNRAGLAMLEAESVEQVRRLTLGHFILPEYHSAFEALHAQVMNGGAGGLVFEARGLKGTRRWLDIHAVPLLSAAGNVTAVLGVTRDITEKKRVEQELAASQRELESRVIQRTAQLAEATQVAEAASRAKSEFLATMSHEIRTPLNGVVGTLELLQGSKLTEQQRRHIQLGKTSALSLTSVINDILDFSKIEAGKLELSPVDFDLRSAVQDVMEMLAVRASEKGLEMACSINPTLPTSVRGDADRLRQVIINLVNNAIKFTHKGSITLRVAGVSGQAGETPRVRFSVTDTGIGIPRDRLHRLFKAFSQADASFSRKYGGTGLGLAICKQLAELMGGGVGVDSEPGVGSTFWFEAALPAANAASGAQPAAATVDCRNLRLLVVEDHEVQREFIAECLASLHFPVEAAADGEAALAMMIEAHAAAQPFAAVLTDHEMPGMDGVDVAVVMKSRPELASIPVILLSSALDLDPAHVRAAGFAAHLTKPLRQSTLLDAVMAAVAPKAGAIVRATSTEPAPPPAVGVNAPPARTRVLLAEDNEINQLIACELLSRSGFDCTVAANGIAAVAAVAKDQFDLVLMDCQMPEMDGFEATREIRRLEQAGQLTAQRGRRLTIIALTANALKGDRERCLEAGMDDYATKPIDLKCLLATIELLRSPSPPVRAAA